MADKTYAPQLLTIELSSRHEEEWMCKAEVRTMGDGCIDHWMGAFRAALVAAGYSCATANRLQLAGESE